MLLSDKRVRMLQLDMTPLQLINPFFAIVKTHPVNNHLYYGFES
mgnify:CR=1 FL=1|jgi:hypothetical protein